MIEKIVKVEPIAYVSKRYSTSFKPSTRIIPDGSEKKHYSAIPLKAHSNSQAWWLA
jgi:hypothetical protein